MCENYYLPFDSKISKTKFIPLLVQSFNLHALQFSNHLLKIVSHYVYLSKTLFDKTVPNYAILITVFEIQTFPGHSILRYSYLFPSRSSRRFVQWLIILLGNVPRLRFILNELSRMIFEHESPKSLHILSFSCPR